MMEAYIHTHITTALNLHIQTYRLHSIIIIIIPSKSPEFHHYRGPGDNSIIRQASPSEPRTGQSHCNINLTVGFLDDIFSEPKQGHLPPSLPVYLSTRVVVSSSSSST